MEIIKKHSYGIIPVVKEDGDFFVALVKHSVTGNWGFPKGTPEKGEIPLETARRELKEETGIVKIDLIPDVTFEESYIIESELEKPHKTNTYFIGMLKDKIALCPELPDISESRWFPLNDADDIFIFQNPKDIVKKLKEFLAK